MPVLELGLSALRPLHEEEVNSPSSTADSAIHRWKQIPFTVVSTGTISYLSKFIGSYIRRDEKEKIKKVSYHKLLCPPQMEEKFTSLFFQMS